MKINKTVCDNCESDVQESSFIFEVLCYRNYLDRISGCQNLPKMPLRSPLHFCSFSCLDVYIQELSD